MSELPKGWKVVKFEALYDFVIGGDWGKAPDHIDAEFVDVRCIRGTEFRYWAKEKGKTAVPRRVKKSSLEKRKLELGDILVEISGGGPEQPVGRTVQIDQQAISNANGMPLVCTNFTRLVRPSNQVNSAFLNYFLTNFYNSGEITKYQSGSNNLRNLQFKDYVKIGVPLAPVAEQKRIVEKLDEVLAQVDTIKARLDGIPALLKRFRQSVLASAVSGQLTEEWRGEQDVYPTLNELKATIDQERFEIWCSVELNKKIAKGKPPANDKWKEKYQPANPKYNDSNKRTAVEGIRAPWLVTSLDAVSILTTGKTPSTSKDEYWNGDTMFVSPAQIHPEGYLHNPSRYVSEEGCQVVPLISKGSTLIVCIGTVGKVGLLTEDVVINQQINAITPLPSVVHKYMYYWCKTLYPWIIDTARATVNAAILNKSTMSTAPFALPPLEEQEEIVRLVDQYFAFADTIEAQVKKAQARVDNLTQSILAKAFRGELVPQDPNDEPADKLLERIAQARKEAEALAKAAKKAGATKKKVAKSA